MPEVNVKQVKSTEEQPEPQREAQTSDSELPLIRGGLTTAERFWRGQYRWLKSVGYQLRPRFDPDWVPSWYDTSKSRYTSEDGQTLNVGL